MHALYFLLSILTSWLGLGRSRVGKINWRLCSDSSLDLGLVASSTNPANCRLSPIPLSGSLAMTARGIRVYWWTGDSWVGSLIEKGKLPGSANCIRLRALSASVFRLPLRATVIHFRDSGELLKAGSACISIAGLAKAFVFYHGLNYGEPEASVFRLTQ